MLAVRRLTPDEREKAEVRIAAHEAGHCLYIWHCPRFLVTGVGFQIIEQPNAVMEVGVTVADCLVKAESPAEWFDEICLFLAGIAGEAAILGKFCGAGTGPDMTTAVGLARRYVSRPGWTEPITEAVRQYPGPDRLDVCAVLTERPPLAVQQVLRAGYRWTRGRLDEQLGLLKRLAAVLYIRKSLSPNEIAAILGPQDLAGLDRDSITRPLRR